MKFSVIITAHDEGFALRRAMESVKQATKDLENFEIIVHVDNGTVDTVDAIKRYRETSSVRILKNSFGDTGVARNFAASKAGGEYLFFMDGDDLISENYITESLKVLEKSERDIVICPEYCMEFSDDGKSGAILRMANSESRERDAFMLFSVNLWIMAIAGKREIFLQHPYIRSVDGYGHEDYALNIELSGAGIEHHVVPETIYFYRRKKHSRQDSHNRNLMTQPYNELFDFRFWQKMEKQNYDKNDQRSVLGLAKQAYLSLKQNKVTGKAVTKLTNSTKKLVGARLAVAGLSKNIQEEWKKMALREPKVNAKGKKINVLGRFGVNPYCPASAAYLVLSQEIKAYPDKVILTDDATDARKKHQKTPGVTAIVVLSKRDKNRTNSNREVDNTENLDNKDSFFEINYAEVAKELSAEQKERLLTRLLVQLKTQKLEVINSPSGDAWVETHQALAQKWMQ